MQSNIRHSVTLPPSLDDIKRQSIIREPLIVPYNDRQKTDIFCTVLYCVLSTIVISTFFCAYILEKDDNILRPIDPDGRICGIDQAIGYGMVYFPTPFPQTLSRSVCVKQCPTSSKSQIKCLTNSKVSSCHYNITDHFNRTNQFIMYPTKPNSFLSLCEPSSKIIFDAINSKINTYQVFKNFSSIYDSLYIIIGVCPLVSILLVIIYVFLITQIQNTIPMFKAIIFCFLFSLYVFAAYSFTFSAKRIFIYLPYIGIFVGVFAIALTAYFIYYRNYIDNSLELLNMGVEYVRQNRSLIFMSLVIFLIWIVIFVLEIIALVFIYSINSGQVVPGEVIEFAYFAGIQNTKFVNFLIALTIVHFIWTNFILYHCGQYICMSASAFWILGVGNNFKNALFTLLRFHIGSVIYGSIANPTLGIISGFLYLIMPQSNQKCCFLFACKKCSTFYQSKAFEQYLGIYNDLNYIQIALKGKNYIEGGRSLSKLLINNVRHVSRAYRIARTIVIISKILVALFTTVICYAVVLLDPRTRSDFLTNIIIFLFSSFLVSFAFGSYDRSFEVILLVILMKSDKNESLIKNQYDYQGGKAKDEQVDIEQDKRQVRKALEKSILDWFAQQKQQQDDPQS